MKVALVEISASHEECLYSQVQFLKGAVTKLHVYVNPAISKHLDAYPLNTNQVFEISPVKGFFTRWTYAFKLAKSLKAYNIVVFNTASSSKVIRNLVLILNFYKVKCVGILHDTKKLHASFTQSLISTKIKKYLVLSDHLEEKAKKESKVSLSSFYPIFFPEYELNISKPKDEIWVVIPGSVDFKRRDYGRLLIALNKKSQLGNVKFIILGKLNATFHDGEQLLNEISKQDLAENFVTFDDFIPNAVFHQYMKLADYVLPLLALNEAYLISKISGSFNMAIAYKKPILLHTFFTELPDMSSGAIFYDEGSLLPLLGNLNALHTTDSFFKDEKWSHDFQRNKYLNFVLS